MGMKVYMAKISLFLIWIFILVSCGDTESRVDSLRLDSCFLNYESPAELTEELNRVSQKSQAPPFMIVQGCLHYQLGHYSLAEEWLKKAFQESAEDDETKDISASALSLIYLKEFQKQNIKPYIRYANRYSIGRWALILYHIDNYRETGLPQHLQKAITQVQAKNSVEVSTSATKRLLQHMLLIKEMEDLCGSYAESTSSVAEGETKLNQQPPAGTADSSAPVGDGAGNPNGGDGAMGNEVCERVDLEDEKQYLFSTAQGFLSMLVKAPPFNNFRPSPPKKEEETADTPE